MGFHESIAPDETARFEQYAAELTALQRARAKTPGKASRVLHVKGHLGVVGQLTITAGEGARVGAFAEAGRTWPVYVRFSNGSTMVQNDRVPDLRGFAVKLVGVPGRKIIPGLEDEQTQDFLFIQEHSIAFRDPHEFMTFVRAAKDGPAKLLPRMLAGFGVRRSLTILRRLSKMAKVRSFAEQAFHTATPISFGATAAKLALFPLQTQGSSDAPQATSFRDDLVAQLKAGPLSWSVRAQLFVDDHATPIEDTSVAWSAPWVELGTLTLPVQDADAARGREIDELVESLSFDPWHAVEAHRPLGAMMRARAIAYRESVLARKAAAEPKSVLSV